MAKRKIEAEWAEPLRDLQRLKEMHLTMQGKHSAVRNGTQGLLVQVVRWVEAQLSPPMCRERSVPATEWSAMQLPAGRSLQPPCPMDRSNAICKTLSASVSAVECR